MRIARFFSGFVLIVAACAPLAAAQSWRRAQGVDSTRNVFTVRAHAGVFYASTDTLVYRSDDGVAWRPAASQPTALGEMYYFLHAQDSGPHAGLYAGSNGQGVFRTADGGTTWRKLGANLPAEDVLGLTVLGDSLFAGLGFSGIYVLDLSNPVQWVAYNTGLTSFGANGLNAVGNRLFAGLGAELFVRERGAAQWSPASIGDGEQRQFYEIVEAGPYLFGATANGVWRASAASPRVWRSVDVPSMKNRWISSLVVRGSRVYAGLNAQLQHWIWSTDSAGLSWDVRAHEFAEVLDLLMVGDRMWAGRADGLWYYDFAPAGLKPAAAASLRPAKAGGLPARRLDGRAVERARRSQRRSREITLPRNP